MKSNLKAKLQAVKAKKQTVANKLKSRIKPSVKAPYSKRNRIA